jgi:hypothetical protein
VRRLQRCCPLQQVVDHRLGGASSSASPESVSPPWKCAQKVAAGYARASEPSSGSLWEALWEAVKPLGEWAQRHVKHIARTRAVFDKKNNV